VALQKVAQGAHRDVVGAVARDRLARGDQLAGKGYEIGAGHGDLHCQGGFVNREQKQNKKIRFTRYPYI
jgi:hypothetical protein